MWGARNILLLVLSNLIWSVFACTPYPSGSRLAAYLHSETGFKEWQRSEENLQRVVDNASGQYRREASLDNLKTYEKAVREYLDHGFILFRAYNMTNFDLPPGLVSSLERRTNDLMDVADEYIRQGSIPMGVGIAREIILKYSDLNIMDRAQHRAEGVLLEYRYRRN